jgi:hypothetical protein
MSAKREIIERYVDARIRGIEALRELLLADRDVRQLFGAHSDPGEDLEIAVNDYIMGSRQAAERGRREYGISSDEALQQLIASGKMPAEQIREGLIDMFAENLRKAG